MLRRFRCVQIFLKHAPNRWCGKKSLWICYCCMVRWQHSYISYIISTLFNCVEPRTLSLFCLVSLHGDKCKCTMCVCVCVCVFSSHPFWTSSSLDVPAGVTQEEGHTGFLIHLPSAVRALIFVARRIQPFLSLVDREVEFCVLTN